MNDWRDRISVNPSIRHGQACIKGTRVMVSAVLDNLAAGFSVQDIVESYPSLTSDDIRAALTHSAGRRIQRRRLLVAALICSAIVLGLGAVGLERALKGYAQFDGPSEPKLSGPPQGYHSLVYPTTKAQHPEPSSTD